MARQLEPLLETFNNNKMKNTIKSILAISFIFILSTIAEAQSKEKVRSIIKDCENAKQEFLKADFDMEHHFNNAYAYVIIPNVGKGGIGLGGAAGTGILYRNGKRVGIIKLTQVSIGFQFGGQAYRELIFIENKDKFNKIKNGKIKVAAQVSAVAATEGASADAKYDEGIMIFTMQKGGLMYEAAVGGQVFKFKPFRNRD